MATPRVWLVTGCSSGFGEQFIKTILKRGDKAIATARKLESIKELENEGASILQIDVTDPASELEAKLHQAIAIYGHIDVLINNAGFGQFGAMEDIAPEVMLKQFQTNVFGPVNLTRAILPHFRERNSGSIVLVSSIAAVVNAPGMGPYLASKAAVDSLFGALRMELASTPIQTIILQPGGFRTALVSPEKVAVKVPNSTHHKAMMDKTRDMMNAVHNKQPGNPVRLVDIAIEMVTTGKLDGKKLPSKLSLGSDAVAATKKTLGDRLEEVADWESVSVSTDFNVS